MPELAALLDKSMRNTYHSPTTRCHHMEFTSQYLDCYLTIAELAGVDPSSQLSGYLGINRVEQLPRDRLCHASQVVLVNPIDHLAIGQLCACVACEFRSASKSQPTTGAVSENQQNIR